VTTSDGDAMSVIDGAIDAVVGTTLVAHMPFDLAVNVTTNRV
jgi:hypothetical protein